MAHRGFSRDGLENSMAAFRAAVDLGYQHLETDVHTTADGVLLLFHDETLDRVTDGRGRIADLPAAEVAAGPDRRTRTDPAVRRTHHGLPGRPAEPGRQGLELRAAASPRQSNGTDLHDRVLVASFSDRRRRAVLKQLSRPAACSAGIVSNALFVLLGPVLPGRAAAAGAAQGAARSPGAAGPRPLRCRHRGDAGLRPARAPARPAGPRLDHQRARRNAPAAGPRRRRDRHGPGGPAQGGPPGARDLA